MLGVSRDQYDVVVVGAGIAGLMCANFLQRAGRRTLLLEHNHQAGGCMNGIRRKGYYFECGDQSFESLGIMLPLVEELGLFNPAEWERADYRLVTDKFDVKTTSFDAIEAAVVQAYPHDEKGIRSYFQEVRQMSDVMASMWGDEAPFARTGALRNARVMMQRISEFARTPGASKALRWMSEPGTEFSKRHFNEPELLNLFGDVAYSGATALFGTMFWHIWVHDYWYPRQGLQWFIDRLVDNFKSLGGEVKFNRTVDEICVEDGRVSGLRTHKDDFIGAGRIVHCGDYRRLFTQMLPEPYRSSDFSRKLENAAMSEPLVSTYLGLNMSSSELAEHLSTHHTFYFPSHRKNAWELADDPDLHKDCFLEVTWTSKSNPDLAPKAKSSLVLQTITNYRWNNYWGTGGDDLARPEAYKESKDRVARDMIETLGKLIPGVEERVDYCEVGSPQSTIRYTLNAEGASCSWRWDPKLTPFRAPRLRTPVRGLYTAGHYAMWPGGVPTAALSGKIVADLINRGIFSEPADRLAQGVQGLGARLRPLLGAS